MPKSMFIEQIHYKKRVLVNFACNTLFIYKGLIKTILSIAFVLSIMGETYAQKPVEDTATVALVNGEPIAQREFMLFSLKERSQVIRFFRSNYGSEYDKDFWTKSFEGKSPSDVLKEKTLDTLIIIKVQQICARDMGIINDISYPGFLKSLEIENKRRLEAKRNNQVIYGPVQYSEDIYFSYTFTNMVNKLKRALTEKVFRIPDDTLKEIYEADKDRLFQKGYYTKIRLVAIKLKPGAGIEENVMIGKDWYSFLKAINDSVNNKETYIETAKEAHKNDTSYSLIIEDIIYNDSIYSTEEDNTTRAKIKETVNAMKQGETSPVLEFPGAFYIFQVKAKTALGYRSFTDCKRVIRESLVDQLYSQYMNLLFLKAHLEIKTDVLRQIVF